MGKTSGEYAVLAVANVRLSELPEKPGNKLQQPPIYLHSAQEQVLASLLSRNTEQYAFPKT